MDLSAIVLLPFPYCAIMAHNLWQNGAVRFAGFQHHKKALAAALKSLMQTQAFEKISVGEICEVCELSRKSFYYHFKDKYDLVEWIFHTEFITAVTSARVTDRWVFVRALCDYFYRERAFYAKLFHLTGQHSFRQYFSEYLFQTIEPFLRPNISLEAQQNENYRFFISFISDAVFVAIFRWLDEGAQTPPGQFVHRLQFIAETLEDAACNGLNEKNSAASVSPQ